MDSAVSSLYLQLQVKQAGDSEGERSKEESESNPLKTGGEQVASLQQGVDGRVEDRDHDEDHGSIGHLDVVWLEGEDTEEVSVHPGSLESPPGALLVKQGPEYGQRQHHEGHVVNSQQGKLSVPRLDNCRVVDSHWTRFRDAAL